MCHKTKKTCKRILGMGRLVTAGPRLLCAANQFHVLNNVRMHLLDFTPAISWESCQGAGVRAGRSAGPATEWAPPGQVMAFLANQSYQMPMPKRPQLAWRPPSWC